MATLHLTKNYALKQAVEKLFFFIVFFAAICSIIFLFAIILSIFREGISIFKEVNFFKFLFSTHWHPDREEYGILSLIVGSIGVTTIALIVGVPLGIGSAIYISEIAGPRQREILKPFIELLAGMPSVIYGLFGMAFLDRAIQTIFKVDTGLNATTAGIILGVMTVPIIASVSEDALNAVPRNLREASFALGANKIETIFRVVLGASKSGVISGVILGFGRAIGETMVVLMVAGNSAIIPSIFEHGLKAFLQPVRPMTSAIALEMGEAASGSNHFYALYAIAIVLFVITFLSNIITEWVKGNIKYERTKI